MTALYINKASNVYAKLTSEDKGLLRTIQDKLSVYVDGYMFSPKFRAKIWDGKIRYLNLMTGEVYMGIVNRVIEIAEDQGATVKISKEILESFRDETYSEDYIKSYVTNLKISNRNGEIIELRDYQINAVVTIIRRKRRLIASPTSSGKSAIIYAASRFILDHRLSDKVIIIVPTIGLIKQMKNDFIDYSQVNDWAAYDEVSEYGGGKKNDSGQIVVATWQSIFRKDKKWYDNFNTMIVDEAHQAKANSLVSIGKNCNAEYRIGLSGSFEDSNESTRLTISGIFGNKTTTISTRELIDSGWASDLKIKCVLLKHNDVNENAITDYKNEMQWLVSKEARNKFIIDLATGLSGNTLLLFQFVQKQGLPLYELAKKTDRKVYIVYGGVDVDERERIRQILEKEKDAIVIASYQTFSTGISINNLHNIVFASPTKSFTRVIQSIGRGLRLLKGKSECVLFDLFDHLSGDKSKPDTCNVTYQHFIKRLKIYEKEKHNYEFLSERID